MRRLFSILAVAVAMVSACDHPVGPVDEQKRQDLLGVETPLISGYLGKTTEELTFARFARGFGPAQTTAAITAVRGAPATLTVYYAVDGVPTNQPLLEFELGPNSLVALNGVPIQSTEIRVWIDDEEGRFIFRFEPHGLTFSPLDPARLRVYYHGADRDMNQDTEVNLLDAVLLNRSRLWQREGLLLPWVQIPTLRLPQSDILEGRVDHFTGFAMAD